MNIISQLQNGATFWAENTGLEIDMTVETGASVQYKQALKIVSFGNDTQRGIGADMAIGISADGSGSATAGFARGLSFGTVDGKWAFTTTSTLIGTYTYLGGAETLNALNGVDFSAVTFASTAFKSPGFNVNPSGKITSATGSTFVTVDGTNGFGSVEIGGTSTMPFIDWHSASTLNDYDVRMQVSGGTASTDAQGTLNVTAGQVQINGMLPSPDGGMTPTLAIYPVSGLSNGLLIGMNAHGSRTAGPDSGINLNSISITDAVYTLSGAEFINGLGLYGTVTTGFRGARQLFYSELDIVAAPTAPDYQFYVAIQGVSTGWVNVGGGAGTEKGAIYGGGFVGQLACTTFVDGKCGTHYANVTAAEFNSAVNTDGHGNYASVLAKSIIQLSGRTDDKASGDRTNGVDAMLWMYNQDVGVVSFKDAILVGGFNFWPLDASVGTVLRTASSGSALNGVDLRNTMFSGSAFLSHNFNVFQSGAIESTDGTSYLIMTGADGFGSIEMGGPSLTPFFDWHSSSVGSNDYDVRMQATGGTNGTDGVGTLDFIGTMAYLPRTGGLNKAFTVSQNVTGVLTSGTCCANLDEGWSGNKIVYTDSGVDTSPATSVPNGARTSNAFYVAYVANGTKSIGTSIFATNLIAVTPAYVSTPANMNQVNQFVSLQGITVTTVNMRGTDTGANAVGAVFGGGFTAQAQTAATNLLNVTGVEINASIDASSTSKSFSVLSLATHPDHRSNYQASVTYDTSLNISAIGGAAGLSNGILFSDYNGAQPIKSTGTLIATYCPSGPCTVKNGIDFHDYTFSGGYYLRFPSFYVDDSGDGSAHNFALNALTLTTPLNSSDGGTGVNNAGRTLTISTNSGTLAFPGASTTMTFPSSSATLARIDNSNTFAGTQSFTGLLGVTSADTSNANFTSITASDTNNGVPPSNFNSNKYTILAGPALGGAGNIMASFNSSTPAGFLNALAPGSAWIQFNISGNPLNLNKESGGSIVLWGPLSSGSSVTFSGLGSDATHTDNTVCTDTGTGLLYKGSGTLGICLGTSGRQFKTAFQPMQAGLNEIVQLKLWNYRYLPGYGDGGARIQFGSTAQDVEQVLPVLVGHDDAGEAINYDIGAFLPIALRAIQELKADNDNLRSEVESLKRRRH